MKSWMKTVLIAGIAALGVGCTAKLDPADLARIEAASNSAEAAANKCQAAADDATAAAARAADSAEAADRAARKAEAIFGSSLRK
jgi:hypothetical protein